MTARKTAPPRAWQRMLSGRRLDLLDPSPLDVEIEDIAQGLSRVARWNGQTKGDWAYTVAQHSLLVEKIFVTFRPNIEAKWRLAALLHDAPEYVVGDLITPFKAAVGRDYKDLENRLMAAVHLRFGLPAALPQTIAQPLKRSDRAAAHLEATQIAGFEEKEARKFFGAIRGLETIRIRPQPPEEARQAFLSHFHALSRRMGSPRT
jgi:5'-deoxynucleotidase YfbR-like HD superfamily hydrolase